MSRIAALALIVIPVLALVGCATSPKFDTKDVDASLTPSYASAHIDNVRGRRVIWGGMILASTNLKDSTQIEILSYPLDSSFRPDIDAQATGRFLIIKDGYLEPADYAPGRLLSVSGSVQTTQVGQVGDVSYTYPVVQPQDIYLWWRDGQPTSRVHFGIGVSIVR